MKKILLLVVVFVHISGIYSAIIPTASTKYYILQTATKSGKVIGSSAFNEVVVSDAMLSQAQLFTFIPVDNKTDTYYIKNGTGNYLINSIDDPAYTEYSDAIEGANCEWVLEGNSLNSVRLKSATSTYLATTNVTSGSIFYCNKTATDVYGLFKLVPENAMVQNNLIDPGFENAVVEGAPIGLWINDNNRTLGNDDAITQIYRSRIINNGYQSAGTNAFLLRFYGDQNSYTKISHQLTGLTKGASYEFSFKYKQGNVNTADATVSSYISLQPNTNSSEAIGTVFTSTPPTTTSVTQMPASGIIRFVAPATECYVVFAKNPASTSNFLFYPDDMVLTKISEPIPQIFTTTTSLSYDDLNRKSNMIVTGVLLSDSIRITTPDGITVSTNSLASNATAVSVEISFTGFSSVSGNVVLSSGAVSISIPVSASYSTSFVSPSLATKYYIQQRTGGKVIGKLNGGNTAALRYAEKNEASQLFEFLPVLGKTNCYYIVNGANEYLSVADKATDLLNYTSTASLSSEWVIQGVTDTLVYITQATNSAKSIGSDSIIDNVRLLANYAGSSANSAFVLHKESVLNTGYMFDPTFENNPKDGGPLGTWIPSNEPIQLGNYGYSRVQGGNGWASGGDKCMYLRFLGEATSYNSISQKLFSLTPGATYRLDLQYKCQSTSATSLVNIYAATTPNADKSAAIGGIYSTTVVASNNSSAQPPQNTSVSFIAPSTSVYIVYSKNTTGTNFNFYIDNLILTETVPSSINQLTSDFILSSYFKDNKLIVDICSLVKNTGKVDVFSIDGQLLSTSMLEFQQGINHHEINTSFKKGIYLIKLSIGNRFTTLKVVNYEK